MAIEQRTLFLHSDDTQGFVLYEQDNYYTVDWYGVLFDLPESVPKHQDFLLIQWVREYAPFRVEEIGCLGGTVVFNPFKSVHEFVSDRGGDKKKVLGRGRATVDDLLSYPPAMEDFSVTMSGNIVDVQHKLSGWKASELSPNQWTQLLDKYFIDISTLDMLIRDRVTAPITVGNRHAIKRLSEEIPHKHIVKPLVGKD